MHREGREKPIASYDIWHPAFNRARPLMGCLDFLVAEGFFTGDDLEDTLAHAQDGTRVPKRLARVSALISVAQSIGTLVVLTRAL